MNQLTVLRYVWRTNSSNLTATVDSLSYMLMTVAGKLNSVIC